MAARIDLNADLGELPGDEGARLDAGLMALITSANIACGGHAGDADSMVRAASTAAANEVAIGAHVSYPDRQNFGRTRMALDRGVLVEQLASLSAAAAAANTSVRYLKPHGALYNDAVADETIADAIADLAEGHGLPVLTIAGGQLARAAARQGVPVFAEFFADRAYEPDGTLRSRHLPGAVMDDPDVVVGRAVTAVRDGFVVSHEGIRIPVAFHSICVHGDTPGAIDLAASLRRALIDAGLDIAAFLP